MLNSGLRYLTNAPWLSIFPGLAISIATLGFNFMGDGLRDLLDPRMPRPVTRERSQQPRIGVVSEGLCRFMMHSRLLNLVLTHAA